MCFSASRAGRSRRSRAGRHPERALVEGLQRGRGPLVGTVIVGLMWAAWHLPNYFRPDWASVNGGFSLSGVAVFATVAVTFSVLITWVYNRTGGSVLMAVLLHASLNFSQGLTAQIFPAAKDN